MSDGEKKIVVDEVVGKVENEGATSCSCKWSTQCLVLADGG